MSEKSLEDGSNDSVKTKVTHNPGWNDPPVLSYDAVAGTAQSKTPKRGLLLNKRVAFPLSSQPPSNKPPTTNDVLPAIPMTSASPPVQPGLPLLVHSAREEKTSEENVQQSLQKEEALQKVMEGFEQILKDSAHDFEKSGGEIRRRLDVMKRMWEEDQLKPEIYTRMIQLSEALTNADGELADHIHMGLMVDHVSLCSPWMVGVRQLIHHVKSRAIKQDDCLEETLTSGQQVITL